MRRTAVLVIAVFALVTPVGCTKAKASKETFCQQLRRTPSLTQMLTGFPSDDPSTVRRKARQAAQEIRKLERSAPREIRSSVTRISDAATKITKALEDTPEDVAAIVATLRREQSSFVGLLAPGLELANYATKVCHYDLNGLGGTTPGTTRPASTSPATPTT